MALQKKLTVQAFSLVEVLLCVSLLGFLMVSIALPQLYALRVVAQVSVLHQINRSLDNLAAGLAGSNEPNTFLYRWRQQLEASIPNATIDQGAHTAHSIRIVVTWPLAPGMLALGDKASQNTLSRTVYF